MNKGFSTLVAIGVMSVSTLGIGRYLPNEVLVVSKPGTDATTTSFFRNIEDDPAVSKIQEAFPGGIRSLSQIQSARQKNRSGMRSVNVRRIQLKSGVDPEVFCKNWTHGRVAKESIQYVQPNYIYQTSTLTPNDPLSSTGNNFIHLTHTDDAWDITTGTRNIVIAVIDTGTNIIHEDLMDSLWINPNETIDGIDNDNNGYIDDINGANTGVSKGGPLSGSINGDHYHGSHVAGIIAAKLNNSKGIAGVCPNCKIMTIKANMPNTDEFYTSSLVASVEYATQMGANIINMSLGGPISSDTLYQAAIQAAISANIVTVAAAGNDHSNMDNTPVSPASFPEVIAVSATNGTEFDSSYSNFGSAIWVSAPGTNIESTITGSNRAYAFLSGTSMATPVVSGVIGLLKSLQPRLTVANVKTLLQNYSDDLGAPGKDTRYGYGFINAYRLLTAITSDTTAPSIPSASIPTRCESNSALTVQWVVTDNFLIAPIVNATANFYSNSTLIRSETPTISAIGNSIYTLQISTPGITVDAIKLKISAIDLNNNQTSLPDFEITVTDNAFPTLTTPNSYVNDQLAGFATFSIWDASGIATSSIRVAYTATESTVLKTIVGHPESITLNGAILQITLPDFGYVPSLSGTVAIYSSDLIGNSGTRNIPIGSAYSPTITWITVPNDFMGNGSTIRLTLTDPIGVSVNSLSLTFITSTQSITVFNGPSQSAFTLNLPNANYAIPPSLLPFNSTFDVIASIKNTLSAVSTLSIHLRTDSTLSPQTVGTKSQLLAFPNPFDPRSTSCKLAFILSRPAQSGELIIYDLRYRRILSESISALYLLAGYNELPWNGKDDSGEIVPNGTYVAVVTISDDSGTLKLRQKIAVLKQ